MLAGAADELCRFPGMAREDGAACRGGGAVSAHPRGAASQAAEERFPIAGGRSIRVMISACWMGVCCRYDGRGETLERLDERMNKHTLIPVCPEPPGGLCTPRPAAERLGGRVASQDGSDATEAYERGRGRRFGRRGLLGRRRALRKERSPSRGLGRIDDGGFTATLTRGDGVCAGLMKKNGIRALGQSRAGELL